MLIAVLMGIRHCQSEAAQMFLNSLNLETEELRPRNVGDNLTGDKL